MTIRPLTTLRHAATALLMIAAALAGTEIWLQTQGAPVMTIVTSQAPVETQHLLVPNSIHHHELRRMVKVTWTPQPGKVPVTVRVNSLGCRGAEPEARASTDTYRILLLGDDSVSGLFVAEAETISARLLRFLPKLNSKPVEVINAGVPGYCPLLSWLRYDHELSKLQADLVILHVDMSDIADDVCYRNLMLQEGDHAVCAHPAMRLPEKPPGTLMQLARQSATVSWILSRSRQHGPDLLSVSPGSSTCEVGYKWIVDDPPDLRLQVNHALLPIRDLQNSVERSGAQLLVTTAPVLWQVVAGEEFPELARHYGITSGSPFHSKAPFQVLASFCRQSKISFLDASPAFHRKDAAKLFSATAPVLSRLGMALYAHEIAEYLLRSQTSEPATSN